MFRDFYNSLDSLMAPFMTQKVMFNKSVRPGRVNKVKHTKVFLETP